jgi:hypothetical protein
LGSGLPNGMFSNQKSQFGKKNFRASDWKMLIYFMAIGKYFMDKYLGYSTYDHSLHFVFIWYIFSSFGIMHQEKSGNPG